MIIVLNENEIKEMIANNFADAKAEDVSIRYKKELTGYGQGERYKDTIEASISAELQKSQ